MKAVINIDYLKLHIHTAIRSKSSNLTTKIQAHTSRHYSKIEDIYLLNRKIATLESKPHSKILHEKSALLKIENKYLYSSALFEYITMLIDYLNAEVINISRLDICADFTHFKNRLEPATLINRYLKEKIFRIGRGKFTVIGSQQDVRSVEYLRFGTKHSAVNTYLYNKSKEMREVRHKAHIAEAWKQNGLQETQDIWRLEHSLKAEALTYFDTSTGEIVKVTLESLKNNQFVANLFESLTEQYFEFRINDGQKNKSRMKKLQLFVNSDLCYKRIKLTNEIDVTKRDKVLMKNIYKFNRRNVTADQETQKASVKLLAHMASNAHLYEFLHKKKTFWDSQTPEE